MHSEHFYICPDCRNQVAEKGISFTPVGIIGPVVERYVCDGCKNKIIESLHNGDTKPLRGRIIVHYQCPTCGADTGTEIKSRNEDLGLDWGIVVAEEVHEVEREGTHCIDCMDMFEEEAREEMEKDFSSRDEKDLTFGDFLKAIGVEVPQSN